MTDHDDQMWNDYDWHQNTGELDEYFGGNGGGYGQNGGGGGNDGCAFWIGAFFVVVGLFVIVYFLF